MPKQGSFTPFANPKQLALIMAALLAALSMGAHHALLYVRIFRLVGQRG